MKKNYITPVVEFEVTEKDTLMTASGNYGQAQYNLSDEYSNVPIDAVDGDESDSKMGYVAFADDYEFSL